MQLPLKIQFRNLDHSDAVEAAIKEKAEKLERFSHHITSCNVVIEADHQHKHKGNLFHCRIDITVPGKEIVVSREPHKNHAHENAYVTIRDAFDAAKRQLDEYEQIHRRDVKAHSK